MNISDNTSTNCGGYDVKLRIKINSRWLQQYRHIGYSKTSDVYIFGIESLDINSANGCICTNLTGDNTSSDLGIKNISSIEMGSTIDIDISPPRSVVPISRVSSPTGVNLRLNLPCLSRLIVEECLVGGSLKNDTAVVGPASA